MIGGRDFIAEFVGAFSISYDFADHWRGEGERFDRQWEDRFIREEGYTKYIPEVLNGLTQKWSIEVSQISKVVYPCLYGVQFKKIAKVAGLSPEQAEEPLIGQVGYTGASDPLMHLIKALEEAKPRDSIVVVGYGNGADAVLFEITERIEKIKGKRRGIRRHLAARRELNSYEKMITFRNILPTEKGLLGEIAPTTSLSALWRDRRQILSLYGSRCKSCGTPQYPAQRVCVNPDCGAIDQTEDYRFSDRRGTLSTYTGDSLAFTPNPPAIYGFIDFDGGGRYWFDLTDVDLDEGYTPHIT